jgi:hypothetical protein
MTCLVLEARLKNNTAIGGANKSKRLHAKTIADNAEDACVYVDKGKVTAKYEGVSFLAGLGTISSAGCLYLYAIVPALAFAGKGDIAKLLSKRDLHQY